jgi:hypothetical protein
MEDIRMVVREVEGGNTCDEMVLGKICCMCKDGG